MELLCAIGILVLRGTNCLPTVRRFTLDGQSCSAISLPVGEICFSFPLPLSSALKDGDLCITEARTGSLAESECPAAFCHYRPMPARQRGPR
jgi:hypothetical protein